MRLFTILLAALVAFTSVPSMAGNIIPAPRKYEKRSGKTAPFCAGITGLP